MKIFFHYHLFREFTIFSILLLLLSSCSENHSKINQAHQQINTTLSWTTKNKPLEARCITNPRIYFFMYHYIRDYDPRDSPITHNLSVPPNEFREHMKRVRKIADEWKISLMNGDNFIKELKNNCFSQSTLWIFSSDDGWSDTYTDLYPIINEYKIPFFLGIVTDFLDKKGFVSSWELITMSANPLITIASHSINHLDNSKLNEEMERREVCDSKEILEKLTHKEVGAYIYPSGKMNESIDGSILKDCGYTIAWSTGFWRDYNTSTGSLFNINRIRIQNETKKEFFDEIEKFATK